MRNIKLLIAFLSIHTCLFAQNEIVYKGEIINALDKNGQQTGIWKAYDDKKNIVITTAFNEGVRIAETKYYKDSQLIAAYQYNDQIEIYKDGKTIKAQFFIKEDNSQTIVDKKGKELDAETLRYFYLSGDVPAQYYGGTEALYDFISKNIEFKSLGNNSGRVVLDFVIDTKGKVGKINITESSNPALNLEAIRIISILPRWQPGHQGGKFINYRYTIPIVMSLN